MSLVKSLVVGGKDCQDLNSAHSYIYLPFKVAVRYVKELNLQLQTNVIDIYCKEEMGLHLLVVASQRIPQ